MRTLEGLLYGWGTTESVEEEVASVRQESSPLAGAHTSIGGPDGGNGTTGGMSSTRAKAPCEVVLAPGAPANDVESACKAEGPGRIGQNMVPIRSFAKETKL